MQAVRVLAVLLAATLFAAPQEPVGDAAPPFGDWLQSLIVEARQRGYSENLVAETLANLQPIPRVIKEDRSQAELVVGFNRYYRSRITALMVRRGRDAARGNSALLTQIQ